MAVLLAAILGGAAEAACRQALALGLDVSGSVDATEYRLQLDGLAGALLHPDVRGAFLAAPGVPVRLMVYEWAGSSRMRTVLGWTEIATGDDLENIAAQLRATQRVPQNPATALGGAMVFGATALRSQPDCWRRTLDISGDGKSNTGPEPRGVRESLARAGITINGLVIGADAPVTGDQRQMEIAELSAYYRADVILGPDAFVEVALGFQDFEAAMARKLLRELQVRAVSQLRP
ncbi:DUF1194 domain-containing protein [Candidatus Rhodobacter oscarellae]|uniref:DUF1194 domain-containing protein n=1 Tax=Candidatus Rhodobacter oscarellae TaxID=1675527 RepID=UPI002E11A6BB